MGLDTVELIHKIENRFAIRLPDTELAQANTVQEVYAMVLQHLPADVNQQTIYNEVLELIAEQTGLELHEIKPHHSLTDDLGLD